ncbi:hypothetical protein IAR55_006665 [Kwoniella newhampshirensis]|uniref:Uncharacterized protein n=1 Tax=Kwoniella newhampshirensis TaxID=1651941 RepID=A0AAW0YI23_9TREE
MPQPTSDFLLSRRRRQPRSQSTSTIHTPWVEVGTSHLTPSSPGQSTSTLPTMHPTSSRTAEEFPSRPSRNFARVASASSPVTKFSIFKKRALGNEENIDMTGEELGSAAKDTVRTLKRRSMQLLRMSFGTSGKDTDGHTKDIAIGASHSTKDPPNIVMVSQDSFTLSTPPPTPPSPSLSTPSLTSFTLQPFTPLPDVHNIPYSLHEHAHSATHWTSPISKTPPVRHVLASNSGSENTPSSDLSYPSLVGDSSDSSGIRGILRPRYSRVPQNTPLSTLSTDGSSSSPASDLVWRYRSARRILTYETLINDPLPPPNGEPSRYSLPSATPVFSQRPIPPTHGRLDAASSPVVDSTPAFAEAGDPVFEACSALEALWEYGSDEGDATNVDLAIDVDDYPLPPSMHSSTTEPPPLPDAEAVDIPVKSPTHRHAESDATITYPIGSALSNDTLASLVEEVMTTAYRIPLKFERPRARRRLSVDSPFVSLYRASNPEALGECSEREGSI